MGTIKKIGAIILFVFGGIFCDRYDQNDLYRYAEGKKIPE